MAGLVLVGGWFDLDLWRITNAATTYLLPATSADAIVILGCGAEIANKVSACQVARTSAGVDLWKTGYSRNIILTGGNTGKGTEAQLLATVALQEGVTDDQLIIEDRSLNTVENLRNSQRLMNQHGWSTIILVSDPFHLYRARQQAADLHLAVVGWWPAVNNPRWRDFRIRSMDLLRDSLALMVYESGGWFFYRQ